MEENRVHAVNRAEEEENRRHELRLQNLAALKEQIQAHETAKVPAPSLTLVVLARPHPYIVVEGLASQKG